MGWCIGTADDGYYEGCSITYNHTALIGSLAALDGMTCATALAWVQQARWALDPTDGLGKGSLREPDNPGHETYPGTPGNAHAALARLESYLRRCGESAVVMVR